LQKKSLKKSVLYFTAAITWLLISTFLLTLPGNKFPQENWLDRIGFDKIVHLIMFALLVYLWCLAISSTSPASTRRTTLFKTVALIWFVWGIAMEFVQRYCIPYRSFDSWDIAADGAGALLGFYLAHRYIKK
jgi:VanZ like family